MGAIVPAWGLCEAKIHNACRVTLPVPGIQGRAPGGNTAVAETAAPLAAYSNACGG